MGRSQPRLVYQPAVSPQVVLVIHLFSRLCREAEKEMRLVLVEGNFPVLPPDGKIFSGTCVPVDGRSEQQNRACRLSVKAGTATKLHD